MSYLDSNIPCETVHVDLWAEITRTVGSTSENVRFIYTSFICK